MISSDHKSNTAKKPSFYKKLGDILYAVKPIIWSHHPLCSNFKEHTFSLFGKDLCIGCYIGYPSAISILVIGYGFGLFGVLNTAQLWLIGSLLTSAYLLSIFGLTKMRFLKILSKISVGAGSSFIIGAITSLQYELWFRILFLIIFIQTFILIINVKRMKDMDRICAACEYHGDYYNCPGMSQVKRNLKNIGYLERESH